MKRLLLVFSGFLLVICVFALLDMAFSPRLRLGGVMGLGFVVILVVAWMLAVRRSRAATRRGTPPQRTSLGAVDLDEATSLRNQPTWRDHVDGRVGPKW